MTLSINLDLGKFKEQLNATAEKMHKATRPAAQAGAEIIYQQAKALAPVSEKEHYFHIRGQKYGPYQPGNLRNSIYQVFSESRSFKDVSTYEISWNRTKAPYGFAMEFGNSKRGAKSFIARAVTETRKEVREAMKQRFIEELAK